MEQGPGNKTSVAVIGSGMAGLVTAHILHNDPQQRYQVTVLEKKNELSLNSESIAITSPCDSKITEWADVPMRAIAGGFYNNLIQMYDYFGIQYRKQPFLFTFASIPLVFPQDSKVKPHMIHPSNFHQVPPKPLDCELLPWLIEGIYVALCYLWFTLCCFFIAPYEDSDKRDSETLDQYLRRIWLPQYYSANYMLPLMSGVCTCSHDELLGFPARDFIEYKKSTHKQQHYVVDGGVQQVQEKLSKGVDVAFGVCLTEVKPTAHGVEVSWYGEKGIETSTYDRVVLAVSPDIVGSIFPTLQSSLGKIPTCTVETVAHEDWTTIPNMTATTASKGLRSYSQQLVQNIHFRSDDGNTETAHEQSTSLIVTTNPLTPIDPAKIIRSSIFTRVLRSPLSRRVVNSIFRPDDVAAPANVPTAWRSGDDGIYVAGGWCWDGMVLLEGCIISASRVAESLGVEVPWTKE